MRRGGATRVRIRVLRIRAKTAENQDLRSSVLQTMEQETRVATQFHLARHVKAQPHIFCLCQEEVGASLESACPLHVTLVELVFGCAHVSMYVCLITTRVEMMMIVVGIIVQCMCVECQRVCRGMAVQQVRLPGCQTLHTVPARAGAQGSKRANRASGTIEGQS